MRHYCFLGELSFYVLTFQSLDQEKHIFKKKDFKKQVSSISPLTNCDSPDIDSASHDTLLHLLCVCLLVG